MTDHEICVYRITDKPMVCEICGKPAEQPDAPKLLTVADVLKVSCPLTYTVEVYTGLYTLLWVNEDHRWRVWRNDSAPNNVVFESPDESAACAEFLRLTGGLSK